MPQINMKILNQIKQAVQNPSQLWQTYVTDYIAIDRSAKQLVLKPKTVLLLCQQAKTRVEQLKSLKPDANEGLIATFEQEQIDVKIHFTPEKIVFRGDTVEGHLRLLKAPAIETDSLFYRALVSGWRTFLGGYIPNQALPEGVRVEGDKVYYQFPKGQLRLLNALFHRLEDQSALDLSLKQGELRITSVIAVDWSDFKLQDLAQIFGDSKLHKPAS